MVAVAVGDNNEIECCEVHTLGLHIVCEDLSVVAGIKKNTLSTVLNERSISPVLLHRRGLAKRIIKNRDLSLVGLGG